MMENGRTKQIIDKLVDMIENGQSMPLSTGKVAVNKDEAVLLLRELENIVSGELKIYREVNDKRGRIITDAKKEAEDIIHEAEQTASRIRVSKRVSAHGSAFLPSDFGKEEKHALRTANDIYVASLVYTDEMLTEVNDVVAQAYDIIQNQYGKMVETLEEKAKIIAENKAELMSNLKELSKEERYAQILELGQLLSYELYNERNRAKETEKKEDFTDSAFASNGEDFTDSAFVKEKEDYTNSAFVKEKEDFTDSAFAVDKNTGAESDAAKEKAVALDSGAFANEEIISEREAAATQVEGRIAAAASSSDTAFSDDLLSAAEPGTEKDKGKKHFENTESFQASSVIEKI